AGGKTTALSRADRAARAGLRQKKEPGGGTSVFFIAKNPCSLPETRPPQNGRPTRPTGHHGGRSGGPFVRYTRLAPRAKLVAGDDLRCQLATQFLVQRRAHLPIE